MQIAVIVAIVGLVTMLTQKPAAVPPVAAPAAVPVRAPERVILLPEADGKVGALALRSVDGSEQRIDQAYQAADIGADGKLAVKLEDAAAINARYAALLAARPAPPVSFTVYFRSGSSTELTPESQALLERLREATARRAVPEVQVIGHTDRVGSDEANDVLSQRRAETVKDILIKSGLGADMIETSGRGEREPLVPTADGVDEARNRRVEITVR